MTRDLGVKYSCFKCGAKFYDLHKPAPLCPKCGADQRETPARLSPAAERKRSKSKSIDPVEARGAEVEVETPAAADDDDEDDAVEDAPEFGDEDLA